MLSSNIISTGIHIHRHCAHWGLVVKYDIKSTNRIWLLLDRIFILAETAFSKAPWWINAQAVVIIPLWRPSRCWLVFTLRFPPVGTTHVIRRKAKSDRMYPLRDETRTTGPLQACRRELRGGRQKNTETGRTLGTRGKTEIGLRKNVRDENGCLTARARPHLSLCQHFPLSAW